MNGSASVGADLWAALRRRCPPGRDCDAVRVDMLAGDVGVSEGTVRQYLREWAAVDAVGWPSSDSRHRSGRHLVRLLSDRAEAPVITRDATHVVCMGWPSDDHYWTLDYRGCSRPRAAAAVPVVSRIDRRAEAAGVARAAEPPASVPAAPAATAPETGRVLADDPAAWTPTAAVYAAAARICSLYETAQTLAASIEAQTMEALHVIRAECPDEEAFRGVVAELTPLRPAEALRLVQTWDVVRRQRDLRQLASARPREAMSLVRGLVDAGADEAALAQFTAADADVAAVLALPPRRRNARLQELLGAEGTADRHPADVERIAALEARVEALAPPPLARRLQRWREVVERVRDAEAALAEAAADVAELSDDRAGVPPAPAGRLLRLADSAQAALDALSGTLLGRSE